MNHHYRLDRSLPIHSVLRIHHGLLQAEPPVSKHRRRWTSAAKAAADSSLFSPPPQPLGVFGLLRRQQPGQSGRHGQRRRRCLQQRPGPLSGVVFSKRGSFTRASDTEPTALICIIHNGNVFHQRTGETDKFIAVHALLVNVFHLQQLVQRQPSSGSRSLANVGVPQQTYVNQPNQRTAGSSSPASPPAPQHQQTQQGVPTYTTGAEQRLGQGQQQQLVQLRRSSSNNAGNASQQQPPQQQFHQLPQQQPQQQQQQQQQRRGDALPDLAARGGGGGEDSDSEETLSGLISQLLGANPELRQLIKLAENYIPFFVLLGAKIFFDHIAGALCADALIL